MNKKYLKKASSILLICMLLTPTVMDATSIQQNSIEESTTECAPRIGKGLDVIMNTDWGKWHFETAYDSSAYLEITAKNLLAKAFGLLIGFGSWFDLAADTVAFYAKNTKTNVYYHVERYMRVDQNNPLQAMYRYDVTVYADAAHKTKIGKERKFQTIDYTNKIGDQREIM